MKVPFLAELRPSNLVYINRPPQRLRHPESVSTDPLTGNSHSLEKQEYRLEPRAAIYATGPYTAQSVTESSVTVDKDRVAIPVSLERETSAL